MCHEFMTHLLLVEGRACQECVTLVVSRGRACQECVTLVFSRESHGS